MTKKARRAAIIGAGPAGAITTDAFFKEQEFSTIRVFERQSSIGGTWNYNETPGSGIPSLEDLFEGTADKKIALPTNYPCWTPTSPKVNSAKERFSDTGSHGNIHSNLPPEIMCFTQEPIPKELSRYTIKEHGPDSPFRPRKVIKKWIEGIFERGNYEQFIELDTTVELAERRGTEWVLTLRKFNRARDENYWWQERFDVLAVATGHFYLPYVPNIPGILEYDKKFPGRIQHSKHYQGPEAFQDKRVIVVGGSISAFDSLHDIRQVAKCPVISSLRRVSPAYGGAAFQHPDFLNRPQISGFDAENDIIRFADGTTARDVDVILFATGYDFSFPFLPSLGAVPKRVPGLFEHVFKIDDPSLVFIGMVSGGFGMRIFEWQAVAAARVLSGHASLPSQQEMLQWEKERLDERGEGGPFWTLMPDFERYFRRLQDIAGPPAKGTTGRVLPNYQPQWADSFWSLLRYRTEWWQNEAKKATFKQSQL